MRETSNECVDCGLPCRGNACPYRNVTRLYCDNCHDETTLYEHEGQELCLDCIIEKLDLREVSI